MEIQTRTVHILGLTVHTTGARTALKKGYSLRLDGYVNGEHYVGGSWDEIHWSFGEMLAQASVVRPFVLVTSSAAAPSAPDASWRARAAG